MNLISQNCLAAEIYRIAGHGYQNPFASTVIDFDSMKYLIENWENVDFLNPTFELSSDLYPIVTLNRKCKIEFVHYRQSSEFDEPRREGAYVFYNDIIAFAKNKYITRIQRMLKSGEKPLFCICNFKTIYQKSVYTKEQLDELDRFENTKVLMGTEELTPDVAADKFYDICLKETLGSIQIYVVGSSKNRFIKNKLRTLFLIDQKHSEANIDELNPWYCELTGLYHLWKNSKADIIGLEHYCRYFANDNHQLLDADEINHILSNNDIIMRKYDFIKLTPNKCAWDHLSSINLGYIIRLLDWAKTEERDYIIKCLKTLPYFGQCNMFIAKKEVIDSYCEWFFRLASKFDRDELLRFPRGIGYLSEFIFSAWIMMKGYKIFWHPVDEYNKSVTVLNGRY